MPILTYLVRNERTEAAGVDAWRDQDAAVRRGARLEAGFLLRKLQLGETVSMPHSRPMPSIDPRCHELRVNDANQTWRIVYSIEEDAIVILEVFSKKSRATPKRVLNASLERFKVYRSL